MTDRLWEALQPPPWFGVVDAIVIVGVLFFIYWGFRWGEARIRTLKMCFSNTVMGHDFWSQAFESLAVTPLALSTGIPVSLQD